MINEWFDVVCEENCDVGCPSWDELKLPEDPDCCTETELGQICGLYFDPCCNNPIEKAWNESSVLAWAGKTVSNTTPGMVKYIPGEGGISKADKTTTTLAKGKTKTTKKTYTLTFQVKCIGDDMNLWMRNLEKGNTNFKFWYESLGGYFYGGLNGISPTSVDADKIHENDNTSVSYWEIVLVYDACVNPPRITNPMV